MISLNLNRTVTIVAVVGVLMSGFLTYVNRKQADAIVEARARVQDARLEVKAANAAAERALLAAQTLKVDTIVVRAKTAADKGDYKTAYEEQKRATARLQLAVDTLVPALKKALEASNKLDDKSGDLVKKTGRSFVQALVPEFGIHATVGVDPLKPQDGLKKVVGVGAHWSF